MTTKNNPEFTKKVQSIIYRLDFKMVDNFKIKDAIGSVLATMPDKIVDFVDDYIEFLGSDVKDNAFTINLLDLNKSRSDYKLKKRKYIIFLDSNFLKESKEFQQYIIAHEIGHAYLKHPNGGSGGDLSQEYEADEFAAKYGYTMTV